MLVKTERWWDTLTHTFTVTKRRATDHRGSPRTPVLNCEQGKGFGILKKIKEEIRMSSGMEFLWMNSFLKREGSKLTIEGRKVSAKGWWDWKQAEAVQPHVEGGLSEVVEGLGYLLERLGWWEVVLSLSGGKNLSLLTKSRETVSQEELWNSRVNRNSSPESFYLPSTAFA